MACGEVTRERQRPGASNCNGRATKRRPGWPRDGTRARYPLPYILPSCVAKPTVHLGDVSFTLRVNSQSRFDGADRYGVLPRPTTYYSVRLHQMARKKTAPMEMKCDACNGTGFRPVIRPARPGRRVYPPSCRVCGGKGRVPSLVAQQKQIRRD